jgi:hypothetical protein
LLIRLGFVLRPLLRTHLLLLTLIPACSCVYICKFQFCPIHPPLGDYQLQALLHLHLNRRVKGWTAMQAACNCTIGAHPFDFDASSMKAQAHTSCNRCAGYYVRKTAPPLAPVSRLLGCGAGATTRGNPAHGPTVPNRAHRSRVSLPREKAQ